MNEQTKKREAILRAIRRPVRLLVLAVLVALLFSQARLFVVLAVFLIALFTFDRGKGGLRPGWKTLLYVAGLFLVLHSAAYLHVINKRNFAENNTPVDLIEVPNGIYTGTAQGANGEITAEVKVAFGKIENIKLLSWREPIYVYDQLLPKMIGAQSTALPESNPFVFRKDRSFRGLQDAINEAVLPALKNYPKMGAISRATFFVTQNRLDEITINSLMILFIVLIIVDFSIGPVINPGTGQSLNCYNCQACVGVCPVKMAEGVPFPMGMVIETRLGRYETVAHLAKYCVGCGRCAAKCPVGNSGPSIASAAFVRLKLQKELEEESLAKTGLNEGEEKA